MSKFTNRDSSEVRDVVYEDVPEDSEQDEGEGESPDSED